MRIALVNTIRHYGGGEKWVIRAGVHFARRGHAPLVLGVPDTELAVRCREAGIAFAEARLNGCSLLSGATTVRKALGTSRPDIVIACNERAVRLAALARRLPGSPLAPVPLVYRNGLEGSFKNKPLNRFLVAPRIDCSVANADGTRQEMLSFGWISPDRVRLIYNGVDPSPIDQADPTGLRSELGATDEDVVVLAAARLVPEKGHALLLQALAAIPADRRPQTWIAGEGPELAALETMVSDLGLGERVRLLGFRRDIPRLLRAADVLCHPSRREGAPNVVLEAMVAGLPVVGVAASGTIELVREGVTGLLSPPNDVRGLAENLERLCADAALRRHFGAAARERARTEFTEQGSTERWLELLESVVAARSQRN